MVPTGPEKVWSLNKKEKVVRKNITRALFLTLAVVCVGCEEDCKGNPNHPKPPTPPPIFNPADGPFQVAGVEVLPSSGEVLYFGDEWSVQYDVYCETGMYGLKFQRDEDGRVLNGSTQNHCDGREHRKPHGSSGTLSLLNPLYEFGKGHEVQIRVIWMDVNGGFLDETEVVGTLTISANPKPVNSTTLSVF